MTRQYSLQYLGLITGTVILSAGLGLAALAASNESFEGVFAGFILGIIGYKLSQASAKDGRHSSITETTEDILDAAGVLHFLMVVVGTGTIAYGLMRIFTAMQHTSITMALNATLIMALGYAIIHYAVNNTLV